MFAVLLLPHFRLQAALRHRAELHGRAVALVETDEVRSGLREINAVAAAAGVMPGQTASQALARCPELTLLPRSPAQEQAAQAALLEIALTLSPEVEATADGYATIDLRRTRDSDWPALAQRAVVALAGLQLAAQAGVGPNADLAFLAARQARSVLVVQSPTMFLANLAIHELDPSPELLTLLGDWGIHSLGQLTSLPRGELRDRLGAEAGRLWERAAGQTERPLRLVRAAEEFVEACEFEHEVETAEPVLFLLRRFLEQLAQRLGHAYRVAGRMTLTLPLAQGGAYARAFTVPSPTADVDVLFRILHTHLDGLRLEHAATGLRLLIEATRAERQQFQLFESPLRDPNRFGETLGRLAALVGAENVGVVEVLDTHRPDRFRLRPPRFEEIRATEMPGDDGALGLPLRRFRPALPATVQTVRHRPVSISSAKVRGAIRAALGPYRASGGWWEQERWAMEEWDIETSDGGLYRLAREGEAWRVEGSYHEPVESGANGARGIVPLRRETP